MGNNKAFPNRIFADEVELVVVILENQTRSVLKPYHCGTLEATLCVTLVFMIKKIKKILNAK